MECREQVSQFKREYLDSFEKLDLATKNILNAIIDQQDVFLVAHEAQLTLTKTLHEDTLRNIDDTSQEIIREIKVIFVSRLSNLMLILF
jgi:predicted thioredoxin/glutaredoxin